MPDRDEYDDYVSARDRSGGYDLATLNGLVRGGADAPGLCRRRLEIPNDRLRPDDSHHPGRHV